MSKYRSVPNEAINLTSTNRGIRTVNQLGATYEQTKNFYPKRQVQHDRNHTKSQKLMQNNENYKK